MNFMYLPLGIPFPWCRSICILPRHLLFILYLITYRPSSRQSARCSFIIQSSALPNARTLLVAMTRSCKLASCFVVVVVVVVCQMSSDDTDNDFNDMVLVF